MIPYHKGKLKEDFFIDRFVFDQERDADLKPVRGGSGLDYQRYF